MPHGKKKQGNTNKKKKKTHNKGPINNASNSQQRTNDGPSFSSAVLDDSNWNDYEAPDENANSSTKRGNYQSLYVRYKQATQRFKEALRAMVPSYIFEDNSVHSLLEAVDYLATLSEEPEEERNVTIVIPESMMRDLKLSIRVRNRVATHVLRGAGDSGHAYFLSALLYCFAVLRTLTPAVANPKSSRRNRKPPTNEEEDATENRFAALSVDDDEDDDEEDLPSGPVPRPTTTDPDDAPRLTLDELIHGTDRQDAILFLMTLDELMGFNAEQYSKLKGAWSDQKRKQKSEGWPSFTIIEHLMETSVAANFGIQYVLYLEEKLAADHPHMNTIYRLMSVLVFPDLSRGLVNEVGKLSPLASQFKETDASAFLGDCLEKAVRNESDPTMDGLAEDFCLKWQVPSHMVEQQIQITKLMVLYELPLGKPLEANQEIIAKGRAQGFSEYSWLPNSKFIGTKDRYILSTARLLQGLSNVIHERNGHLEMRKGMFGKSWDETRRGMASRITKDMDELLMGDLLPSLINACYGGLLSSKLPREEELMPVFTLLKSFVKNPKKPVSWSLAFAVHAMLTSMFEMQGNNDVHSLAEEAEESFKLYFDQIAAVGGDTMMGRGQPKNWSENLKRMELLKWLVVPPTLKPDREKALMAFWNPFCAGTFLSYVAYFSNLEEGSWMTDGFAQLRMVLHLYNALKDVGLTPPKGREVLEWLDKQFSESKAIWEGPKPTRGNFVRRWWICYGADAKQAQHRSRETASSYGVELGGNDPRSNAAITRRMSPIDPSKLSKSFRRIMDRDFSDVVDKYHTTAVQKSSPLYDHAVRCNDTLDAMESDQRYLATNMTSLGAHLNTFIVKLFESLEWQPLIDQFVRTTPDELRFGRRTNGRRIDRRSWEASVDNLERQAMVHIFAEKILGKLDFQFLDLDKPPDPVLLRASAGMAVFFERLNPAMYMYFSPVEEVIESDL